MATSRRSAPTVDDADQQRTDRDLEHDPKHSPVLRKNIRAIADLEERALHQRGTANRVSDAISHAAGSVPFVLFHIVGLSAWFVVNAGVVPGIEPFDPFPFGLLTMVVSLEAIFLSTFVLVSQNRMSVVSDQRADLDLQINLLAEHEITRILTLVHAMAKKMDVDASDLEYEELEQDVEPEEVLKEMEQRAHERANSGPGKAH